MNYLPAFFDDHFAKATYYQIG